MSIGLNHKTTLATVKWEETSLSLFYVVSDKCMWTFLLDFFLVWTVITVFFYISVGEQGGYDRVSTSFK